MRSRLNARLVLALGTALFLGCSEGDQPARTGTSLLAPAPAAELTACPTAAEINQLIEDVFPAGNDRTAAEARFDQIADLMGDEPPGYDPANAQAKTFNLVAFTIKKFQDGHLIGGTSEATADLVAQLVNGLFCFVGLPGTVDGGDLGPDGAIGIVEPNSPTTLIITPTKWAGVLIDSGSVTTTTLVTIHRLPDAPGPLLTGFDQYPLYYEFDATPHQDFVLPVLVGVCQATTSFPDYSRLQLAHNVAPFTMGSIELLPRQTAPFLDCADAELASLSRGSFWMNTLARVLLPAPLHASVLGVCCLGGTTKSFSPFGAVDPEGVIGANSPTSQSAPVGVAVYSPPSVTVTTPLGAPLAGIKVTFAVTGGGGSVTGAVQHTDASGIATVGSWTLGLTAGANSLTATAEGPAGTSFSGNPVTFSATANPPTQLAFLVQPTNTTAGGTITPAPQVGIQDVFGNLVTSSTAPVTVALGSGPAGATLGGTLTVNAVGGIATFSDLSLTKSGSFTLSATSPGLTGATSSAVTIDPAPPAGIFAFEGDNQTALAGTAVAIPPACQVRDAYGNGVPGVGITFGASNGGSVTGASQVTGADGVARVGSWTLVAGTNYLVASADQSLTGSPVTFTATGTTASRTLVNCLPSNGAGDPVSRAFYIPSYPGRYLKQVDLYLSSNAPANVGAPYRVQLTARSGGYNGPVLGTAVVDVILNGSTSQNLVTHFDFGAAIPVARNSTVAFSFTVLSNPTGAGLFFNTGSCGVGDNKCKSSCPAIETVDASGTLSSFYRKGVGIRIIGD